MKRKPTKKKDKINNIILAIFGILFVCSVFSYFYFDHLKVKKHMAECVEICKPDKALEIFSKKGCYCRKEDDTVKRIDPKDTI